ncbi:hypothetical protein RJD24_04440 [Bacillaceae bacterium IKA-2]|nr:hypothetical protein RJD24_04440 [Bacillaceae bacterium IKA-2]
MEDLLKIVTGNPILLFIIIGALLSFIKRGKEKEANQESQKPGAPETEETPNAEIDWRDIFRQEEKPVPVSKSERGQSYTYTEQSVPSSVAGSNRVGNELLEKYEKAKRNKEAAKIYEPNLGNSPIYKGDIAAQAEVKLDFSRITKEEAIKGVVWAEILGKPRSKNPHRPTLNTRRQKG